MYASKPPTTIIAIPPKANPAEREKPAIRHTTPTTAKIMPITKNAMNLLLFYFCPLKLFLHKGAASLRFSIVVFEYLAVLTNFSFSGIMLY